MRRRTFCMRGSSSMTRIVPNSIGLSIPSRMPAEESFSFTMGSILLRQCGDHKARIGNDNEITISHQILTQMQDTFVDAAILVRARCDPSAHESHVEYSPNLFIIAHISCTAIDA